MDSTKLSKGLPTDVSKVQLRSVEELKEKYGVTLRTRVVRIQCLKHMPSIYSPNSQNVTSVDTKSKTVTLKSLDETDASASVVPYTILILAPGGVPRRLPIPGADLSNVYTLRGLEDAKKIDQASQPGLVGLKGKKIVVVGTSFISMEVSGVLAKRKVDSVHMIGMEGVPFETILGEEVGRGLQKVSHEFLYSVILLSPSGNG